MKTKKKLLGYYDYTVILTYCGMLFAVLGIFLAMRGGFALAAVCLLLAGICDMFDGTVAATKDRTPPEKRFGIQIDSLSDLISFGVLPGMLVYCLYEQYWLVGIVSALYILCALIRLAFFNVLEEARQDQTDERRTSYQGVPVTTVAWLLPIVYILFACGVLPARAAFPILLLLAAAGFISPLELPKPHGPIKYIFVVFVALELAGLLFLTGPLLP